ncbi:nitrate reductase molybdenum cofactor assembly chaperone [Nocardioides astragali]|uniref:Nitrate reductase molybdenum cofactor assembly chaperone n=1 Tax=Nocardioides astragali TaxID=1776736 RepID=A0ABW2NAB5_9ACTN|nr:nitrate reductase molybdenum cofactor assembly chaperone [Nocardioides astragali]
MFAFARTRTRPDAVRPVWAAVSVLLEYPTAELVSSVDVIESLVPDNAHLAPLFAHLRRTELRALQQDYVATFDHTRKCALYLTYFAYGDTRRRGMALVQFKETYRAAGVEWDDATGELPDHLCAVLQFGATVDAEAAWQLLTDHRAAVEMLRLALTGWRNDDGTTGSPWAAALLALCDTMPDLKGDEADAVRRLVEEGPPAEEVGLEGYGAPLISPATIPVGAPR